jgi:hypothetical protein
MNVLIRQILSGILFVPLLVMSFVSWSGSGESDSVAVGSFPSSLQTVFETAINKEFESADCLGMNRKHNGAVAGIPAITS